MYLWTDSDKSAVISGLLSIVYEKVKDQVPYGVGVLVPEKKHYRGEWYELKSVKKAMRRDRTRPVSEILLMMFRSAARDRG